MTWLIGFLLVSTHIVCERLSVMQDLAWVRRFCAQNLKNTLFLANQEYTPSWWVETNHCIPHGHHVVHFVPVFDFGPEIVLATQCRINVSVLKYAGSYKYGSIDFFLKVVHLNLSADAYCCARLLSDQLFPVVFLTKIQTANLYTGSHLQRILLEWPPGWNE